MDLSNYKLIWDCHTHSLFSGDAHSTIEENVKSAVAKGIKKIAVTEHGFNHRYGIKREEVAKIRAEIERLKKIYPIEILLGFEANLISLDGDIDLTPEEQKIFDIILLGVHKTPKAKSFKAFWNFKLPNLLFRTKKHQQKVTNSYIKALQKNKIDIVVHLHYVVRVDAVRIAEEASKHNTLIELNNKHMLFNEAEINKMAEKGAKFIIDSDAHCAENVASCPNVFDFLASHDVPLDRIVNLKKVEQSDGQN